ncbi:MAG: PhzF family phenazine biosynthesis protein [Oscillospiraceae bacterium]|nr:PhzF family phenazine biosynthesis protein [Oscillospiraceae bacterium]
MKQYIVDAFTDKVFSGNPAAVCIMDSWLPDELMKKIALENNLSETAFAVKESNGYRLRWFTSGGEIDLCGHATLACAYVISNYYEKGAVSVSFNTLSGELTVRQNGEFYEMEFPSFKLTHIPVTQNIIAALGTVPSKVFLGRDMLCVFDDENIVRNLKPDLEKIKQLNGLLLHITAKGNDFDCVSRSFCPKCGVAEDPVCGSGHCHIIPYWSHELNKDKLTAYQASDRSGILYCENKGDKVILGGKAALFSISDILCNNQ